LAKSFEVQPGDVLDLEVYAKYEEPTTTGNNVNALASSLIAAFGLNTTSSNPLDGQQAYNAFNGTFSAGPYIGRVPPYEDGSAPKAYLNYILFNENFELEDFGFDQISTTAKQVGASPFVTHDLLALHVKVQKKGYLYIYLSNEQAVQTNVYFDDLKITYHTGVEQVEDYYPFGLSYNSYSKGSSPKNRYLYNQGSGEKEFLTERVFDLGLNIDLTKYRAYDPATGRWWQVDPKVDELYHWTPYNYGFNNPILYNDPEGDIPPLIWAILAVTALVLDAEFAEAPGTDQSPATRQREQENREEIRNVNETIKTIVNPTNLPKKIVGQQVREGIKKEIGEKKVPNPNGKKGGPEHQKKVDEVTKDMEAKGMKTQKEVKVETRDGDKTKRYVDVVGTDPSTGKKEIVQVGKQNKNGTPVSREKKAIKDIEQVEKQEVKFVPYNNN